MDTLPPEVINNLVNSSNIILVFSLFALIDICFAFWLGFKIGHKRGLKDKWKEKKGR
jgi:hypothetical protein